MRRNTCTHSSAVLLALTIRSIVWQPLQPKEKTFLMFFAGNTQQPFGVGQLRRRIFSQLQL